MGLRLRGRKSSNKVKMLREMDLGHFTLDLLIYVYVYVYRHTYIHNRAVKVNVSI